MTEEKDTAVCAGMTAEKGTCQGERRKNSRPAGGRLKEIEWSEDGAGHEKWVKEHFTPKALQARNAYLKGEGSGRTRLGRKLDAKAARLMGVPVEPENLLEIDRDTGKYKIIRTIESGDTPDTYKFDTEVLEEGTLKKKD